MNIDYRFIVGVFSFVLWLCLMIRFVFWDKLLPIRKRLRPVAGLFSSFGFYFILSFMLLLITLGAISYQSIQSRAGRMVVLGFITIVALFYILVWIWDVWRPRFFKRE